MQRIPESLNALDSGLRTAREIGDRRQEVGALTLRGHASRRGRQLEPALAAYRETLRLTDEQHLVLWRAWAMIGLAQTLSDAGRLVEARHCLFELGQTFPVEQHPGLQIERLWTLSSVERELGQASTAAVHIRKALDIAYGTSNAYYIGECETELGKTFLALGQPNEALAVLHRTVSIERRAGYGTREAVSLDVIGEAYQALGRPADAVAFHSRAVAMHRKAAERWNAAVALSNLGQAHQSLGAEDARPQFQEALELIKGYDDPRAEALRTRLTTTLRERPPVD